MVRELNGNLQQLISVVPYGGRRMILRTVPGVGEQVSLTLLAYLPELGTLGHRQISALVGVSSTETAAQCELSGVGAPSATLTVERPGLPATASKKVALTAAENLSTFRHRSPWYDVTLTILLRDTVTIGHCSPKPLSALWATPGTNRQIDI